LAKLLLCKWINCQETYFVIVNCSFAGTSILGIFQSKSCATCLAACNVECLPVNVWFDSLAGIYEYGLAREKRGPFGPGVAARTRLIDHFYLVQALSGRSLASLGLLGACSVIKLVLLCNGLHCWMFSQLLGLGVNKAEAR
jgi:hypothetical protein